ncbi:F0F1 ATP synthase subunit A [Granulicoccus phenolivorans]|uniref:F0F1 ATP synthase subunit A n=1 Tax=Granulicoccus phenolivorans TaxID=266854 RepID=UPI00040ADE78
MGWTSLIPMAGDEVGYHAPGVQSFHYTDPGWTFFAQGSWLNTWINKSTLQALIAAILVIVFWLVASRKLKIVPTKGQFFSEYVYDFVRNGIARDILGPDYRRYTGYLVGLFSFLLINNWFGETFIFMYPTFSNIGYAYALAIMTWVIYIGAGIARHGFGKFMKKSLLPPGVPPYLWILIIPLEFLSNFITRPITLALRLFANLFAGHLVVLVFVVGGWFLMTYPSQSAATEMNLGYNIAGVISIVFSFAILALELFIGALQAYIFTVLTAQYVHSSLADDH